MWLLPCCVKMFFLYNQQVIDCIEIVGPFALYSISIYATLVDKDVLKTQLRYMYSSYVLFAINEVRM